MTECLKKNSILYDKYNEIIVSGLFFQHIIKKNGLIKVGIWIMM